MVAVVTCLACQFGFHDEHTEVVKAAPEGMLGGAVCNCKGECRYVNQGQAFIAKGRLGAI